MKTILALILGIITSLGLFAMYQWGQELVGEKQPTESLGAFSDPFISLQLADSPSNGYILYTDGADNYWAAAGAGSQTPWTQAINADGNTLTNLATTTMAADTHLITHGIYALDSSGLHIHASNGTEVAYFGAGGGANSTFSGAISMSGSDANIILGSNFLSGDGGDEGIYVASDGDAYASGDFHVGSTTATGYAGLNVYGTAPTINLYETDTSKRAYIQQQNGHVTINVANAGVDTIVYNTDIDPAGWGVVDDWLPADNNTYSLGLATSFQWSDLFLGTGGVINWNNGDVTLTHASNLLTLAGGGFDAGGATSFEIPNGAAPTVDVAGEFALNTNIPSFSIATSTSAAELPIYPPLVFSYASSSWTATSSIANYATTPNLNERITSGTCYADGTAIIRVGDGTNYSNQVSLSSGTTTVTFSTNNTFNKNGERVIFEIGSPSSVSNVSCNFERIYTR